MPASQVMHKFKHGALHSGSKKGPLVKSRQQAIAIMMSEKRAESKHGGKYPEKRQAGGPVGVANRMTPTQRVYDAFSALHPADLGRAEPVPSDDAALWPLMRSRWLWDAAKAVKAGGPGASFTPRGPWSRQVGGGIRPLPTDTGPDYWQPVMADEEMRRPGPRVIPGEGGGSVVLPMPPRAAPQAARAGIPPISEAEHALNEPVSVGESAPQMLPRIDPATYERYKHLRDLRWAVPPEDVERVFPRGRQVGGSIFQQRPPIPTGQIAGSAQIPDRFNMVQSRQSGGRDLDRRAQPVLRVLPTNTPPYIAADEWPPWGYAPGPGGRGFALPPLSPGIPGERLRQAGGGTQSNAAEMQRILDLIRMQNLFNYYVPKRQVGGGIGYRPGMPMPGPMIGAPGGTALGAGTPMSAAPFTNMPPPGVAPYMGVGPNPNLTAGIAGNPALGQQAMLRQMGGGVGGINIAKGMPTTSPMVRSEARNLMHGPILSAVPGRTDAHKGKVASGSYVIPADIVSGRGQGNSLAGMGALGKMFKMGPYGSGAAGGPKPGRSMPKGMPFAKPWKGQVGGAPTHTPGRLVPVNLSGGEMVIPPENVLETVRRITGDPNHTIDSSHDVLDKWVVNERAKHRKTLGKLPGPVKD